MSAIIAIGASVMYEGCVNETIGDAIPSFDAVVGTLKKGFLDL